MNKNSWLAVTFAAVATSCTQSGASAVQGASEPYQGVVELDTWRLGFEVPGRLATLAVREGGEVAAGAELARLDDERARLAHELRATEVAAAKAQLELARAGARSEEVRAAEAELDAARATEKNAESLLAREKSLAAQGSTTPALLDQRESMVAQARGHRQALEQRVSALRAGARRQELDLAQARYDAATKGLALEELNLARTRLTAPAAGSVTLVHAEPGEVVGAGMPVVTLSNPAAPRIDVFVPQQYVSQVRIGARARLRVDGVAESLDGEVQHLGTQLEFTPRYLFSERERPNLVLRVRVRVQDPNRVLRAGMPGFVTLESASP